MGAKIVAIGDEPAQARIAEWRGILRKESLGGADFIGATKARKNRRDYFSFD